MRKVQHDVVGVKSSTWGWGAWPAVEQAPTQMTLRGCSEAGQAGRPSHSEAGPEHGCSEPGAAGMPPAAQQPQIRAATAACTCCLAFGLPPAASRVTDVEHSQVKRHAGGLDNEEPAAVEQNVRYRKTCTR